MASLHTPGPWIFFSMPGGNWGIRHQSEHRSGGMHADVNCLNRHTVEAIDAARANAQLIAAAPDMLAAIIEAEWWMAQDPTRYPGTLIKLRNAIAKAEGGS